MIRTSVLFIAMLGLASAQDKIPLNFQPRLDAQVMPAAAGVGRGGALAMPAVRPEAGKPFSATMTTQTTQTLADGTHLNRTSSRVEYRDSEGRTRTENQDSITIRDPITHITYLLNPAQKTAMVLTAPQPAAVILDGALRGGRGSVAPATAPPADAVRTVLGRLGEIQTDRSSAAQALPRTGPNENSEDLGTAIVNGVSAHGTRVTSVIPVGAIGNDRELRGVTERWFSTDLNLLIKSVSTDPRFGTTTYELTNIKQSNPDLSLFQVPSDYTTVSSGGRGR